MIVLRRQWTENEVAYLEKYYERRGVDYIAKRLNRTSQSIKRKAQSLGYNAYLCEDLYVRTMAKCFQSDSLVVNRWIRLGLPYRLVQRGQSSCKLISVKDFWKWAEKNKNIIPWNKYERYSILPEPKWLNEAIKASFALKNNRKPITYAERQKVVYLKKSGKKINEIAIALNRTPDSIKHILRQENGGVKK